MSFEDLIWLSLAAYALHMLEDNAVIHIAGVVIVRGRPFPGIFTALALFVPLGLVCFARAASDGVLSPAALWGSLAIALALHATPALLLIRDTPVFRP
jgi:hypothetical protein